MQVFLLWHVRHARDLDGSPAVHRDDSGELVWDEEDGDDLKLLGVYSTEQRARWPSSMRTTNNRVRRDSVPT